MTVKQMAASFKPTIDERLEIIRRARKEIEAITVASFEFAKLTFDLGWDNVIYQYTDTLGVANSESEALELLRDYINNRTDYFECYGRRIGKSDVIK